MSDHNIIVKKIILGIIYMLARSPKNTVMCTSFFHTSKGCFTLITNLFKSEEVFLNNLYGFVQNLYLLML